MYAYSQQREIKIKQPDFQQDCHFRDLSFQLLNKIQINLFRIKLVVLIGKYASLRTSRKLKIYLYLPKFSKYCPEPKCGRFCPCCVFCHDSWSFLSGNSQKMGKIKEPPFVIYNALWISYSNCLEMNPDYEFIGPSYFFNRWSQMSLTH